METLDVIKSRTSVRSYLEKDVEEEKLNELLSVVNIAPSAGPIHISLVENTDLGLGTCYAASTNFAFVVNPSLLKELGIPEGFVPVCSVFIGYTSNEIKKRKDSEKDNITIIK